MGQTVVARVMQGVVGNGGPDGAGGVAMVGG